jgi:nitrite reductase (NADH) large subunit
MPNVAPGKPRLALVGNGMVGMRTVEELLRRAPGRFDITVFGAEPHPNYNRILLSSVLAGEKTLDDIISHPWGWYEERGVSLISGDPIVSLDPVAKTLRTQSGRVEAYDRAVLATGSKPLAPPIPGLDRPGVCTFRDIADLRTMLEAARDHRRAIVIGGGLLGLEAAWGLQRRGMSVTVVHLARTLMERQLDEAAGLMLERDLAKRGLAFCTNSHTEEILGTQRAEGVRLADGREVPADLVVLAIGVRPNIDLARRAGLEVNRGVVVDDAMRTSDEDVLAVGECAEHRGQTFGLLAPLWKQAEACATTLAEEPGAAHAPAPLFTSLKITGIDVFSAGALAAIDEADDEITLHDMRGGIYKKLVLRAGKLVGAVLYGDTADGPWFVELMQEGRPIEPIRDRLVFGRAYDREPESLEVPEGVANAGAPPPTSHAVLALAEEAA